MKIAIITDQHFGARKNSKLFHDYFLKFYEDIFFPTLIKEGMEASLPEPSIKNKYFEMTPISSEEARKQLDLIDHDFYVFRNKINNELQVIYKRNHGGYGLIQSK